MISDFFLVPQAMQHYYGFTPLMAAIGFMPETIPQFIFGYVQSKLINHFANATLLLIGTVITFGGVLLVYHQQMTWMSILIGIPLTMALNINIFNH
ncbi:hypothetical protein [Nicoliella spurrieriana]|nr:hypothetical protein [Nicoliella spurrieriana]